nr:hypothetical protein CFP56_77181 [Quercus suber]
MEVLIRHPIDWEPYNTVASLAHATPFYLFSASIVVLVRDGKDRKASFEPENEIQVEGPFFECTETDIVIAVGSLIGTVEIKYKKLEHLERLRYVPSDNACYALGQSKKCSDIGDVLKTLQKRDKMQEIVISRIAEPAFDRNGVV